MEHFECYSRCCGEVASSVGKRLNEDGSVAKVSLQCKKCGKKGEADRLPYLGAGVTRKFAKRALAIK